MKNTRKPPIRNSSVLKIQTILGRPPGLSSPAQAHRRQERGERHGAREEAVLVS
jgi:hypothetical protein